MNFMLGCPFFPYSMQSCQGVLFFLLYNSFQRSAQGNISSNDDGYILCDFHVVCLSFATFHLQSILHPNIFAVEITKVTYLFLDTLTQAKYLFLDTLPEASSITVAWDICKARINYRGSNYWNCNYREHSSAA